MGAWGRIFFFVLIFAAVAMVVAAWLSGPVAAQSPILSTVVLAMLGAGFVALIGGGLWSLHAEEAALDADLAEREADRRMATALRAEIDLAIRELSPIFDPAASQNARRRAHEAVDRAEAGHRLLPLAATPPDFVVFDRSDDPLSGLPEYAIRRVVQFHQTVSNLRGLVDDIRAKRFDDLARSDRSAVVDRYYDLGASALFRALKAKAALSAAMRDVDRWSEGGWRTTYLSSMERSLAERILNRSPHELHAEETPVSGLIEQSDAR